MIFRYIVCFSLGFFLRYFIGNNSKPDVITDGRWIKKFSQEKINSEHWNIKPTNDEIRNYLINRIKDFVGDYEVQGHDGEYWFERIKDEADRKYPH